MSQLFAMNDELEIVPARAFYFVQNGEMVTFDTNDNGDLVAIFKGKVIVNKIGDHEIRLRASSCKDETEAA